ncbi:HAD-IA family hydrolase [Streptomyces sp. NPDC059618]|uniref:HAD-IA family hydrolase n=1 Tax=Streptomyces sp. NPDC059618 TaxID=3346887 RepID=UPI0036A5CD7E
MCETGVCKPDPRAFEMMCARLEVRPADCLFIDDSTSTSRPPEQQECRLTWNSAMSSTTPPERLQPAFTCSARARVGVGR